MPLGVSEMSDFQLGDRVVFSQRLRRRTEELPNGGYSGWMKVWREEPMRFNDLDGIIVGRRTLSNGKTVYHGMDDPIEYKVAEHFTAYLVAFALLEKPVFVLPESLALKEVGSGQAEEG